MPGPRGGMGLLETLRATAGGTYAFQCAPPARAMASRELRAIATRLTSFMLCPPPTFRPTPQVGDMENYRGSPNRGTSPTIGVRQSTYSCVTLLAAFLGDSGTTRCLS